MYMLAEITFISTVFSNQERRFSCCLVLKIAIQMADCNSNLQFKQQSALV